VANRDDTEGDADAAAETNELNALSQPMGYAVTHHADADPALDPPADRRFTVHRMDQPSGEGPTFHSARDVRGYLDGLEKLPRWQLDLDDDSVEFDNTTLTVTDKNSGESFCLRGWKSFGISGMLTASAAPGASPHPRQISVVAEQPPTIGHWHQADPR
jgi:hypothetical protein